MRANVAEVAERIDVTAEAPARGDMSLELLSSIAHELRAPLSSLMASAEMLQTAEPDDQERFGAIIQRQAQRLANIVEGLLEAYRAPRAGRSRVREIIDVEDLLTEVCGEQEVLFPRHRFTVDAPSGRRVSADRKALTMVLGNLVSNAAKYSPAETTVRITCDRSNARTTFRVYDEGPGVPAALRRRIFRPGDRGMLGGDAGCGLGLFIAQHLCEAIGADIAIEETPTGRGSCFAVTLAN